MLLGRDELTILRGSKFYGTWQWINSVTGEPEDFAGLSAIVKIKNIHEEFSGQKNTYEVGIATVEPLDVDENAFKGRVDIELSKADTLCFAIPEGEEDKYGESDFYAILEILLSTGEVILQAKVRVIESLESETLIFLLDEKDEAIIINGKLDNILLRNDEFTATRDNLIDVVIPTAIDTYNEKLELYNENHVEKLDTYNLNHTEKVQSLENIATAVNQDKNIVNQDKLDVESMKQNVQENKDSVTSMKDAIEIMLDNFDDRFLGVFDNNPLIDNDSEALLVGAIYYNNTDNELRFYNGVSWDSPVAAAQTYAQQASQSASNANTSKLAAKTSEDNAKLSEETAIQKALETSQSADSANTSKLAAKTSEDNAKLSEETAIQKALETSQSADSVSEDRVAVEQLEASVQNLALQVESDKQTVSLDKQTVSNAKTDVENIRDSLQTSVNDIANKINISDIQDLLTSNEANKPLSANQGRILKGFIDNINNLLSSDDTTLDELQEIVSFIKQNKSTLDSLSISNIAGLVDALSAKADAIDVYSKTILDLKISTQQFDKPNNKIPLIIKVSPSSVKIPSGFAITVGANSFKLASDYTLTLAADLVGSTKSAGTDYFVYAKSDATFYISADDTITTDRLIGGFHYGLVGEIEAATGNKTEAMMVEQRGIWSHSCWDLKFKPTSNPRGMNFAQGIWVNIYLADEDIAIRGYPSPWKDPYSTTRVKAKIAAGTTEYGRAIPKIPLAFGGNGTLTYGKFTWFQACELASSLNCFLFDYSKFPSLAYGVNEQKSSSTNGYETTAGAIEHYPNLTSRYMEQAAGVQWIWGRDVQGIGGDGWKTGLTDGRGDIYAYANQPTAVLLGGFGGHGVNAGSRASHWNNCVWGSYWHFGCRFACDHLELE